MGDFMYDIAIERVNLNSEEKKEIEKFLGCHNLLLDSDVEYTAAARLNGEIVGTCSYSGKVIKCFAVREDMQGQGIASKLVTHISNIMFDNGIYSTFIFTKPENIDIFKNIGWKEVYSTGRVALLEGGMADIKRYVNDMFKKSGLSYGKKASVVMNCNPFTIGHRYLVEKTSKENEEVVVFIVEENKSAFPFDVRYRLVKEGVKDLKNVRVIPGGDYIISSATFPTYFIKHEDDRLDAYTRLDAGIFGRYIAPVFNIEKRYVGTEPYCRVTEKYNSALMDVLPGFKIEVKLIKRLENKGAAISASGVRKLIKNGEWDEIRKMVPDVTYEFLTSDEGKTVVEKMMNG